MRMDYILMQGILIKEGSMTYKMTYADKYNEEFMLGLEPILDRVTSSGGYKFLEGLNYSWEDLSVWINYEQKKAIYTEVRGAVFRALTMRKREIPLAIHKGDTLRERIISAVLKYRLERGV